MKSKDFYKTTAWKWFSKYILLSYSNNGAVQCVTSGKWYQCNDKRICAGHLVKVFNGNHTNFNTAFDFRNVMPQSDMENRYKGGNELVMMQVVDRVHGEGTTQDLISKSKHPFKLDKYTLDEIAKEYRLKFNELTKIKGNPWKK